MKNNNELSDETKNGNLDKPMLAVVPSDDEIETASIDYREVSDEENTDEETMLINVNWYDKQEAFTAGVKWFMQIYC